MENHSIKGDALALTGNAQEIAEHRKKYNEEPLRINHLFSCRFVFIAPAAALIFMVWKTVVKPFYAVLGIALLGFSDLWSVDIRYLNKDNFEKTFLTDLFQPTASDQLILVQLGWNIRVLHLNNPCNESKTSYYYKSIGDYSLVKIRRYQSLFENGLTDEIKNVLKTLQLRVASADFLKLGIILNMLHTCYIKANEIENGVLVNPNSVYPLFVQKVQLVNFMDAEIAAHSFGPAIAAIVDLEKFKVGTGQFYTDGTAQFTEARSNRLKYSVDNAANGLLVFSAINYPEG